MKEKVNPVKIKSQVPSDPKNTGQGKSFTPPSSGIEFTVQKKSETDDLNKKPIQRKENETGLPGNLKSGIENLSGVNVSDVKVHYNSSKPAQLNAHAYAQGNQIHIAPGQEKHLAHEAWHVVQQKQGRVKATTQHKSKKPVMQLAKINKAITGITHLVKMIDGSIYNKNYLTNEVMEVEHGDIIEIDSAVKYMSRRGPNQEAHHLKDQTGLQHYKWFKVISVNRFLVGADVFVREDTLRDVNEHDALKVGPWLVFGTNGKDGQALSTAVENGYRRFDCAESYGNTRLVAEVLHHKKIKRKDYEIIYKFDVNGRETSSQVIKRLRPVFAFFDMRIDSLIIHNLEGDEQTIKNAWTALNQLKAAGLVKEIGLGNVKPEDAHLVGELKDAGDVDVVENSLESIVASSDVQDLIKSLGAKLTYYGVLSLVEEVFPGNHGITKEQVVKALLYHGQSIHAESSAVLSSSDPHRQADNLAKFGNANHPDFDGGEEYEALGAVDKWKRNKSVCNVTDMAFALPGTAKGWLSDMANNPVVIRARIKHEVPGNIISIDSVSHWLIANTPLTNTELVTGVPQRSGMKKRYVGKPLAQVLYTIFSDKSCDWKWAIELVSAMLANGEDWDAFGRLGSAEIVEK